MAGVFPDGGVPSSRVQNGVDVSTANCVELFYSAARCEPRFEPEAQNAVISEILKAVSAGGNDYDCRKLDNLALAIARLGGITNAAASVVIQPGRMVRSSDGDVFFNCTSSDITPASSSEITTEGLLGLGMCPAHTLLETATESGTDSYGVDYGVDDILLNMPDGSVFKLTQYAKPVVATADDTDSFGNTIIAGQAYIQFGDGRTLATGGGGGSVGLATPTTAGTVELATPAESSSGQGSGSVGPLVITPEVLQQIPDMTDQLVIKDDKVLMLDDSTNRVHWVKMSSLPGGGEYDYKEYQPNGFARRSVSGSGLVVNSGRALPWVMPVSGAIEIIMIAKTAGGQTVVTETATHWFNVNQGDTISFSETGPGRVVNIRRNGTVIMSLIAYNVTASITATGEKTGSWLVSPVGRFLDTNAPIHYTDVSGTQEAYDFNIKLFAST